MKKSIKHISAVFVFGVVATLVLFGTAYSDSNEVHRKYMPSPDAFSSSFGDTMSSGGPVTLSGTVNPNSQFIDNRGRSLNLTNTDEGLEVQSLVGQRVEIKGTVMDEGGQKSVDVQEYKIINERSLIHDGGPY
jgi:hypothetical protein